MWGSHPTEEGDWPSRAGCCFEQESVGSAEPMLYLSVLARSTRLSWGGGKHVPPSRVRDGLAAAEVRDSVVFAFTSSSRIHRFPFLSVV